MLSLLGKGKKLEADDAVIDATVILIPNENGTFRLGAALDVMLPSIDDAEQAADLVRAAHRLCPYSNATRGNIDVALTANGAGL